ncbi:MAG: hypothetical protein ACRENO_07505, partial [Thermodesulfobacteriota bacterium]
LYADSDSRVLRFALAKGQIVKHLHLHSPVQIVVLKGSGVFEGDNGYQTAAANSLLLFSKGEKFSVKTDNDKLVFLALFHGAERADPNHAPIRT